MSAVLTRSAILIVDDEPLARSRMRRLVDALPGYQVCGEAENGEQALVLTAELSPDIILMDIRMPGMDGLEAARQISLAEHSPAVIFCTAYDDYAVEAFQVQAIGYLMKPVRVEALEKALSQCARLNQLQVKAVADLGRQDVQPDYYVARTYKGTELIDIHRIRYFIADQKYVTVHHGGGETLVDDTLKEVETRFPDQLLRIHRSTLVNKTAIEALERQSDGSQCVVLQGGEIRLPVSRRHVQGVKDWMACR